MDILQMKEGIHLVYKPVGPTSHDIVDWARKQSGITRIGHAGTLDPFAEGLLILLVGKDYTRRQSEFLGMDKTYEAVIHLGATSNTDDCTGKITPFICHSRENGNPEKINTSTHKMDPRFRGDDKHLIHSLANIKNVIKSFTGTYEQMPPNFSAKKISGTRAYKFARKGETPELKPKKITIHSLELLSFDWPLLSIRATVSSGTYIRALARDIGVHLGCGAYCETLKRTAIGPYSLTDAIRISTESPRPHHGSAVL
ncbi:tRNA pseudouridine(55) synthase TruB [Candidatus Uhrbacteria bacterium]|nr:tRNA pseudouridine(55) synthase TruB [Candidatus Uhrbacteria bacterium]